MLEEGLGAVVSGPDAHPVSGQNFPHIVGMDPVDDEGEDAVVLLGLVGPQEMEMGDGPHPFKGIGRELQLPLVDLV